jgi:hypothetical protein
MTEEAVGFGGIADEGGDVVTAGEESFDEV